jgi:putative Mn2+ efflux pump MntP
MDALTILLISFGLAMDSFSVSITSGLATKAPNLSFALKVGAYFGFFQAFMPVLGWAAGTSVIDLISGIDHWVAFGLLCLIGCRMIYGATKGGKKEGEGTAPNGYVLLVLAVATSIDALAVGLSLAFLRSPIVVPVIVIGVVSFVLSFAGVYIGEKFGHFFENKIEIAGGLILIAIGAKILVEHML